MIKRVRPAAAIPPRWKDEVLPTYRGKALPNTTAKSLVHGRLRQRVTQDLVALGFHRAPVAGGPHAKTRSKFLSSTSRMVSVGIDIFLRTNASNDSSEN